MVSDLELTPEYNMCLILNPTIILSTVIAQTVNEFIPPGVVLVSLMFFVIVSIIINIINGIKKYKQETDLFKKLKENKGNVSDIEKNSVKNSGVYNHLYFRAYLIHKRIRSQISRQVKQMSKHRWMFHFLPLVPTTHL